MARHIGRMRRMVASLTAGIAFVAVTSVLGGTPAAAAERTPLAQCSTDFAHGDARLGPAQLPVFGPVGREVIGYQRTGTLDDRDFFATYYDRTANAGAGGWRYPPDNGYQLGVDGKPIEFHQTLVPGQDIDRYGSEYGSFLAPAGLPYAARSIPPQSLDGAPAGECNYHDYRVLKPFAVDGGLIAPWFGQPGLGWQYQLDNTLLPGAPVRLDVLWLVDNGYLARVL
jgi:hypothetical protein